MPYLPSATAPTATLPPEEQQPPPEQQVAPATEEEAVYGPAPTAQAAPPVTEEDAVYGGATEVPAPEAPPHGILHDIGDALGGAVAPLMAQAPEPVQNLADIIGQPVGGVIDVATQAAGELVHEHDPGEAATAVLGGLSDPFARGIEQVGQRLIEGKSAIPENESFADPGQATAIQPGLASTYGPAPIVSGITEEAWWNSLTPEQQAPLAAQGGMAMRDAYLASIGASDVPPPQLVNPIDAGRGADNILQSAGNVLGAVPESIGSYLTSQKQGTLGPFLLGTAQSIAEDPLTLLDLGAGEALTAPVRTAGRNIVSKTPIIRDITKLAPTEEARLVREQRAAAASELLTAQERQGVVPTPAEAPATAATPGSTVLPSSNGRQVSTPDLAQPAAAAPPATGLTVEPAQVPGVGTIYRVRENGRMVAGMPTAEAADAFIRDRISATPVPFSSPVQPGTFPEGVGFPNYESVPLRPGAPLRERSALTGRPLIPEGSRPDLEGPLRVQLDSLGLSDIGIKLVNDLRDVSPSAGPLDQAVYRGKERLIGISLDAARLNELPRLIDHEAIHALSDLGLFQGREFDILVNAADRMNLRENIAAKYPDVTPERLNEELVAEVYTRFRAGDAIPAPVRKLLQRIGDFLLSLGRGLRDGLPEDVLRRIESGEVGGRPRTGAGGLADDALMRVYHGSPTQELGFVTSDPPTRQFDNATSQLGGFFTPSGAEARRYAGREGTVYRADLELTNPYQMPWSEFDRLQDIMHRRDADGFRVDVPREEWASRAEELKLEARALREQLEAQGYDGIVVQGSGLRPTEIASFADTPVSVEDRFARQSAARAAYSTADEGYRARLEEGFAEGRDQMVRGVMVTKASKTLLDGPAAGAMKFRDGWQPTQMTFADAALKVRSDIDTWVQGFERDGTPASWTEGNREWQTLNKRFNPNGDVDTTAMFHGPGNPAVNTPQSRARAEFADNVVNDAIARTDPGGAAKTRLGKAWNEFSSGISQMMLFNVLNVPRYMNQNLLGNTVNVVARGGGPKVALGIFTDLDGWSRTFKNVRDPSSATLLDARLKKIGMGDRPNMKMNQRRYFDRVGGDKPTTAAGKATQAVANVIAPKAVREFASVPDQLIRERVGNAAIERGYADLNKRLVPIIREELRKQTPTRMPSEAKVQQLVSDILQNERTVIDPNTNLPYKTITGKVGKHEPVWNADEVVSQLRGRLTEDMPHKPGTGQYNRAINDTLHILREETRKIVDDADAQVDHALFSWRNTVGDEWLSKGIMMHYWMSRQGGFYVSEGLRHPWMAAAYGRMMADMEEQNEELGGPAWMTGWFQFMKSAGGMSTWYSPFDMIGSLLTMADWQMAGDPDAYKDLTELGRKFQAMPFFIHPLIVAGAYELGLLGPDYPAPNITGTESFGARAIDLLNLANASDAGFMKPFNALGVGVDANGNKVPIPPRPLNELYGRVGNAISTALMPITGLSPVEVIDSGAGMRTNIASIGETETRKNYPGKDQMWVDRHVTDVLADPGNPEYADWYRRAAEGAFQLGEGVPQPLAGLARIASPIAVQSQPEQRRLDTMEGLDPSGYAPPRVLPEDEEAAKDILNEAKYGASSTVEGRQLQEQANEFTQLIPPEIKAVRDTANAISGGYLDEPITVGGRTWSNEELSELSRSDNYRVREQYATEQGYTLDEVYATYDLEAEYKAEHPEYAAYEAYKDLIPYGEEQAFTEQMAATNPGFAQYVRNEMTDHTTGEIRWYLAKTPDAYLASQGIQGSVYSPLVGNEPSTIPGGAPSVPGVPAGQAVIPDFQMAQGITDIPLWNAPQDAEQNPWNDPQVATISPDMPVKVIDPRRGKDDGMVQVQVDAQDGQPAYIGYVDASLLEGMEPPAGAPTVVPAVAAPPTGGGLAGLAGGAINALGGAKDAAGSVFGQTAAPAAVAPQPQPYAAGSGNQYTTESGKSYTFLNQDGTPVTPNYGYFSDTSVPDNDDGTRALDPKYIVYHYTATDSFDDFIGEFMGDTQRASSNYVLDKDGTLYTLVPSDYSAWANGDADMVPADATPGTNLNQESISIEIVNDGSEPYTPEQIATLTQWTTDMSGQYGIDPDHLIGHADVTSYKSDPGPLFPWDQIRAAAAGITPA